MVKLKTTKRKTTKRKTTKRKTPRRKTTQKINIVSEMEKNKSRKLCDQINIFSKTPIYDISLCKTIRDFAKNISSGDERETIETFCKDMCFKKKILLGCKGMTKKKYSRSRTDNIKNIMSAMKKKNKGTYWKKSVKLHGKTKATKMLRDAAEEAADFSKNMADDGINTCTTMVNQER